MLKLVCTLLKLTPPGALPVRPFDGVGALAVGPIRPLNLLVCTLVAGAPTPCAPPELAELLPRPFTAPAERRAAFDPEAVPVSIPEPSSLLILAAGVGVIVTLRRKDRRVHDRRTP